MMKFITTCSVDIRKLCGVCIAINYIPLSMAYDTDSTANFLSFGPTRFHVYQKNGTVKRSYVAFEILNLKRKLR